MTDPRWEGVIEPERPEDDVLGGTGCDEVRRGGTVWLVGRHVREGALGVLVGAGRPLSIDEILARLHARGVRVAGDQRKALSDAMRYQARKGRVRRAGRGSYVLVGLPRTSEWRTMRRLRLRSWPWAVWEIADTRPSLDVPLPQGASGGEAGDATVALDRYLPPVLSEEWPSDW